MEPFYVDEFDYSQAWRYREDLSISAGEILARGVWPANNHEYVIVEFPGEIWNEACADLAALPLGYYLATVIPARFISRRRMSDLLIVNAGDPGSEPRQPVSLGRAAGPPASRG